MGVKAKLKPLTDIVFTYQCYPDFNAYLMGIW